MKSFLLSGTNIEAMGLTYYFTKSSRNVKKSEKKK